MPFRIESIISEKTFHLLQVSSGFGNKMASDDKTPLRPLDVNIKPSIPAKKPSSWGGNRDPPRGLPLEEHRKMVNPTSRLNTLPSWMNQGSKSTKASSGKAKWRGVSSEVHEDKVRNRVRVGV